MPPRTEDALAAVRAAVAQGDSAAAAAALDAAIAALELSPAVFEALVDGFSTAVVRQPTQGAPAWQRALDAYMGRLSEEQLRGWRWDVGIDWPRGTASLEVVPWLLARSTKRINALHLERVEAVLDSFEAQFRDDPDMADDGYFGAMEDASMPELIACMDSHERRDELARPLLRHAVRAGAACLSLADARKLALPEQPAWGTAGTWWAEEWAPERAAHAAFHPRFQAAASTLLLALHRGLPGAAPDGGPINLPAPVAHAIVRCMALAPGMEAAWVPLAHVPDGVNLNRAG